VPGVKINRRLSGQSGESALPQVSAYEWVTMLKNHHTSFSDEESRGRPSTSTTQDNTERFRVVNLDIEGRLSMMCKSVMVLFMESSRTMMGFVEFYLLG
jgi:hypothetical protein